MYNKHVSWTWIGNKIIIDEISDWNEGRVQKWIMLLSKSLFKVHWMWMK